MKGFPDFNHQQAGSTIFSLSYTITHIRLVVPHPDLFLYVTADAASNQNDAINNHLFLNKGVRQASYRMPGCRWLACAWNSWVGGMYHNNIIVGIYIYLLCSWVLVCMWQPTSSSVWIMPIHQHAPRWEVGQHYLFSRSPSLKRYDFICLSRVLLDWHAWLGLGALSVISFLGHPFLYIFCIPLYVSLDGCLSIHWYTLQIDYR